MLIVHQLVLFPSAFGLFHLFGWLTLIEHFTLIEQRYNGEILHGLTNSNKAPEVQAAMHA